MVQYFSSKNKVENSDVIICYGDIIFDQNILKKMIKSKKKFNALIQIG